MAPTWGYEKVWDETDERKRETVSVEGFVNKNIQSFVQQAASLLNGLVGIQFRWSTRARVMSVISGAQVTIGDVRVDLSCRNVAMTEQRLY